MADTFSKESYVVSSDEGKGEVRIAEEVLAVISGIAATEVAGVDSMAGNITHELIGKLGMSTLSKGVRITVDEAGVRVFLSLNINSGYNIPEVSAKVQDRVKSAVESMTGLDVAEVDVRIAGVAVR